MFDNDWNSTELLSCLTWVTAIVAGTGESFVIFNNCVAVFSVRISSKYKTFGTVITGPCPLHRIVHKYSFSGPPKIDML